MKNNKALIPFIIATIIALGIIVTTTYDPSAHPAVSQVATTEISTTVSSPNSPTPLYGEGQAYYTRWKASRPHGWRARWV